MQCHAYAFLTLNPIALRVIFLKFAQRGRWKKTKNACKPYMPTHVEDNVEIEEKKRRKRGARQQNLLINK